MNRNPLLFFFALALSALGFCFHSCTSPPAITASQQLNDSLEYYFTVANDEGTEIAIRRHCADRARALTEKMPKDSIYVKNMFRVANRYWNCGELDPYYTVTLRLDQQIANKCSREYCKNQLYIGDYMIRKGLTDKAYANYHRAELYARKIRDFEYLLLALSKKCEMLVTVGDYLTCEKLCYEGLKIGEQQNKIYHHRFYTYLGIISTSYGEPDKSALFFSKALTTLKLYGEAKHQGLEFAYLNNIASVEIARKNYRRAYEICHTALSNKAKIENNPDGYAALLEQRNVSRFYMTRLYSMRDSERAFQLYKILNEYSGMTDCKLHQAIFYFQNRQGEQGLQIIDSLLVLCRQKKLTSRLPEILRTALEYDCLNENMLTDYLTLTDSLQLAERRNRNKFAQIEYQTSELKEQNQQLLTQNQKITIGASSVGVLLLVGLFARHYRARKKEVQLLRERQAADDEIFQLLQQQQEKVEEGRKLEKRRISQELHDGVMGKLSGIRLNLFVLNKRSDPETVSKCLGHIDKIQEVEKEIRSIAYDLENDLFGEDRSFSALVRTLVQSAKEVSTTQFHLDIDVAIQWDAIPNTVKIQLYRVLQEALTNIRKYAQAKAVHITLRQRKQHLWVVVRDDGIGFTSSAIKKGLGLTNMETRIRRQGGAFKLKSVESQGTTLIFTLPITN